MSTTKLEAAVNELGSLSRDSRTDELVAAALNEIVAIRRAARALSGGDGAPGLGDAYGLMDAISTEYVPHEELRTPTEGPPSP